MLNIVLFGPPGAGKGTQAVKLVEKFRLIHLSTGDIFRANIRYGTELGLLAKSFMDQGQLVPDEVTIRMLESELAKHPDASGFIFDGFPRTTAQAEALDALLHTKGTSVSVTLALEVNEEELTRRILSRGKSSGRADDQDPETVRNRVNEYNNKTLPLKQFYKAQGKLHSVNGIGSIEDIFEALVNAVEHVIAEREVKDAIRQAFRQPPKNKSPRKSSPQKPKVRSVKKKVAGKKSGKKAKKIKPVRKVRKAAPAAKRKAAKKKAVRRKAVRTGKTVRRKKR